MRGHVIAPERVGSAGGSKYEHVSRTCALDDTTRQVWRFVWGVWRVYRRIPNGDSRPDQRAAARAADASYVAHDMRRDSEPDQSVGDDRSGNRSELLEKRGIEAF